MKKELLEKELLELKKKMRNIDTTQFKDYDEYLDWCRRLTIEFVVKYDIQDTQLLSDILEKIK